MKLLHILIPIKNKSTEKEIVLPKLKQYYGSKLVHFKIMRKGRSLQMHSKTETNIPEEISSTTLAYCEQQTTSGSSLIR